MTFQRAGTISNYLLQCSNDDLCKALQKIVLLDTHQDEEDSEIYLGKLGQIAQKALTKKLSDYL